MRLIYLCMIYILVVVAGGEARKTRSEDDADRWAVMKKISAKLKAYMAKVNIKHTNNKYEF